MRSWTPMYPSKIGTVWKYAPHFLVQWPRVSFQRLGMWTRNTVDGDPRWCCTYLLDPTDPLFVELGKAFVEQQIKGNVFPENLIASHKEPFFFLIHWSIWFDIVGHCIVSIGNWGAFRCLAFFTLLCVKFHYSNLLKPFLVFAAVCTFSDYVSSVTEYAEYGGTQHIYNWFVKALFNLNWLRRALLLSSFYVSEADRLHRQIEYMLGKGLRKFCSFAFNLCK